MRIKTPPYVLRGMCMDLELMDWLNQYTFPEEKAQIKEIFQKVAELNTILDKYDIEAKFDWNEYFTLVGQCFDSTPYIF